MRRYAFKRIFPVFFPVLFVLLFLSGCGKSRVRELEEYRLNMSRFFENIASYDQAINAIDPDSPTASEDLLRNLDGLNGEFSAMAGYPIPDEFSSISEITQDAADSMNRAVSLYHEAYDGVFQQEKADEARTHYQRASRCIQIIVQVLHGETPSGTGITVTD